MLHTEPLLSRLCGRPPPSPPPPPPPPPSPRHTHTHTHTTLRFPAHRTHPGDEGHGTLAELLASALSRAVLEVLSPSPSPQLGGQGSERAGVALGPDGLPPPMVPGNMAVPTSLCAIEVRLAAGKPYLLPPRASQACMPGCLPILGQWVQAQHCLAGAQGQP